MQITKNPDGTYTVTLTETETVILDRAFAVHGPDVFRDLVEHWLKGRQKYQHDADAKDLFERRSALSQTDRDIVDRKLGLK